MRQDQKLRYEYAAGWIQTNLPGAKTVLDCNFLGESGVEILSQHGFRVVHAACVEDLPGEGDFDAALCFETVETVDNDADLVKRLSDLSRNLVIVVPNQEAWFWGENIRNHKRHYTLQQLKSRLRPYEVTEVFGQSASGTVTRDYMARYLLATASIPHAHPPIIIEAMHGFGDTLYSRPVVRQLAKERRVYVKTPLPHFYDGIPGVVPLNTSTPLRTQAKANRTLHKHYDTEAPQGYETVGLRYGRDSLKRTSIIEGLCLKAGVNSRGIIYDLPKLPPPPLINSGNKPLAVIRPVTVRSEWENPARNPLPEYVAKIGEALMYTHHVVSIADLAPGEEWALDPLPPCHQSFHDGQLGFEESLALCAVADVVVGGVGWIVPAGLCSGVKTIIVLGGNGAHNAPEKLIPNIVKNFYWLKPDDFCMCEDKSHLCNKTIHDFDKNLEEIDAFLHGHRARNDLGTSEGHGLFPL